MERNGRKTSRRGDKVILGELWEHEQTKSVGESLEGMVGKLFSRVDRQVKRKRKTVPEQSSLRNGTEKEFHWVEKVPESIVSRENRERRVIGIEREKSHSSMVSYGSCSCLEERLSEIVYWRTEGECTLYTGITRTAVNVGLGGKMNRGRDRNGRMERNWILWLGERRLSKKEWLEKEKMREVRRIRENELCNSNESNRV